MSGQSSNPLLDVRSLRVRHGGVMALQDVSMQVQAATVVGLIGPNGAGKTTFIDTVSGFTAASCGTVHLAGEQIDSLGPHQRARLGLARTFQSLELFDDLTVRQNLTVAAEVPTWRSTLADLVRVARGADSATDNVLETMGLSSLAEEHPTSLSNAQRHLVALGRALASQPKLLLLDEPAAGLDPDETAALADVISRIPRLGTAVVLVDHDMSLVFSVCERVDVLDFGRLIASGSPASVRADSTVVEAYLGHPLESP